MKILQLNAWTGRIKGALGEFLQKNDYDVICLSAKRKRRAAHGQR